MDITSNVKLAENSRIDKLAMQIEHWGDPQRPQRVLCIDCILYHYLSRELRLSRIYRLSFYKTQGGTDFTFVLRPTACDLIDYKWNERMTELVRERCELDHAFSWLSTLGGAFSALGDYFERCSLVAAKISLNQFKLALRLGDPMIASRCRLYFSLSLIQHGRFKLAKRMIRREFDAARNSVIVDGRLVKMCYGIWAKLQYEHQLYTKRKKIK